jgi:RNA polymerase sigma-70 factor, ECF subfamily
MEQKELQTAILECQHGRSSSFDAVYDYFLPKIYNYLYYRTGNRQNAEDLCSTTFLKAFEHLQSFDAGKGTFQSWIFKIARNTLIDHFRTKKASFQIDEALNLKSRTNIESELDSKLAIEQVCAYLTNLNDEQRDLVLMRVWDDMSYKEISEIVGKSESAIKMSFSRIMTKLKATLTVAASILIFVLIKSL